MRVEPWTASMTPQWRLHQLRLYQVETVEERGHLVQRAEHERAATFWYAKATWLSVPGVLLLC
jgi:hypothetical protein